jgi:threonylcarbamoyladenosine tRNA methylthiotransferase CDKAL1
MDIEDLGSLGLRSLSYLLPWRDEPDEPPPAAVETTLPEGIPGSHKIYVKTWGCSHNNSDGEYMAGLLRQAGYHLVSEDDRFGADLWLLNGCTVKNPSESAFDNCIELAGRHDLKMVLAGCVPQADTKKSLYQKFSVLGVNQLDRVVEVVEETLKGHQVKLLRRLRQGGGNRLDLPKIRKNPLIEILPINTGCLNQCTYCKTKFARGDLNSYPVEDILARVGQVIGEGVKEIWLSSEDTGAYGRDLGTNLPHLLGRVLELVAREAPHVMVRLGMTNPPYIMDYVDEMVELFRHPNLYQFIHIPIQSGSNGVLEGMKRLYTVEDFVYLVDRLKEGIPDLHVATDIIAGFPGETDEDFRETMKVLERYRMITVNISQFYPRRGTPAASAPQIDSLLKKNRTREATAYLNSYQPYGQYVGQTFRVLCTERAHHGDYWVAHDRSYHHILVPNREEYLGEWLTVKIVEADRFFMKGEPVKRDKSWWPFSF